MGLSNLQIAALHDGSVANAAENAYPPQTQAASPVLPTRGDSAAAATNVEQDTVSLSGTRPPQQPAVFKLLTQTTTFPPTQDTTAAAAPPKTQNNGPTVAAEPAAQTTSGIRSPVATATANAAANATTVRAHRARLPRSRPFSSLIECCSSSALIRKV